MSPCIAHSCVQQPATLSNFLLLSDAACSFSVDVPLLSHARLRNVAFTFLRYGSHFEEMSGHLVGELLFGVVLRSPYFASLPDRSDSDSHFGADPHG